MTIKFKIQETEYQIEADGSSYTLSRIGINQSEGANKGKETLNQVGYYSQVKSAVNRAVKDCLGNRPDEVTLKEFIERYEKANQSVLDQIGDK